MKKQLELKNIQKYPFGKLAYKVSNPDMLCDIYADMSNTSLMYLDALECGEPTALELQATPLTITQPIFALEHNISTGEPDDVLLGCGEIGGWDVDDIFLSEVKPVLRPLSDLTKEIDHGGEKFVPIDWLEDEYYTLAIYISAKQLHIEPRWINQCEYLLIKHLLEWHFDVDNLIEKGLAIDLNTLEVNPYK